MPLQARLVQLFAARELGINMDMASWRLRQLTLLLPDMGMRISLPGSAVHWLLLHGPTTQKHGCMRMLGLPRLKKAQGAPG